MGQSAPKQLLAQLVTNSMVLPQADFVQWRTNSTLEQDRLRDSGGDASNEASAVVADQVKLKPYLSAIVQPEAFSPLDHSSAAPEHELELESVHGFSGHACIANIVPVGSGEIVYTASSAAVVHNTREQRQFMFQQHNADITCLAVHNDRETVATGDVGILGGRGAVFVWSAETLEVLAELPPRALIAAAAKEDTALARATAVPAGPVTALSFSKDGTKLVVADANMNMALYDWRKKGKSALLSLVKADKEEHTVLAIGSNPYDDANEETFVSCGVNHVKFWSAKGGQLRGQGWFGDTKGRGKLQHMLCLGFVGRGITLIGTQDGSVYMFKNTSIGATLVRTVSDAHRGSVLCMYASEQHLVTGGHDGLVSRWRVDTKAGQLDLTYLNSSAVDTIAAEQGQPAGRNAPEDDKPASTAEPVNAKHHVCIKSICYLDVAMGSKAPMRSASKLIVGTSHNSIYEIDDVSKDVTLLAGGHSYGRITGVSAHPLREDVFATCGEDATVRLWRANEARAAATSLLPSPAMCLHFAPDGVSLAVGMLRGGFLVLDARKLTSQQHQPVTRRKGAVTQVCYAPSGHVLAAGYETGHIDVYDVMDGYTHLHTMRGHTGAVCRLDFDVQGKYLRSTSSTLELMYWDVDRKVQVKTITQVRNALWQSSRCPLAWHALGAMDSAGGAQFITSTDSGNATGGLGNSQDYVHPRILAVGHAWGELRLYRHPCVKKSAGYRAYAAHTHDLSGLALTKGDARLVSSGDSDLCIKVWRVVINTPPQGDKNFA
jgi:WD40 repeat protein